MEDDFDSRRTRTRDLWRKCALEDVEIAVIRETLEINHWGKSILIQEDMDTGAITRKLLLS